MFSEASPVAHPFIWKSVFIQMQMKTNFHMKGWMSTRTRFEIKKRSKVIRKWPIAKRGRKACKHLWQQMLMWIHHTTQTPSLSGQPGHKRFSSSAADSLHQLKGGFQWLRYKTDTKICDCQASQEQFWCYVEETFGRAFCWYLNIDTNYHWKLQLEWTFLFWVSSCVFFTANIKNGKIWLKTRYSMPDSACNIEVLTFILQ